MPSRNVIKQFAPHSYYHVYSRGVDKQTIFRDDADKQKFLKLLERHLDPQNTTHKTDGTPYRKFDKELELLCYCLMGNHFHLLFYQADNAQALTSFMRSAMTAYTMYFNKKYKRVGPLFQGVYRSSRISGEDYLLHISRYIHLNPRTYKTYGYSSIAYYTGTAWPVWLKPQKILDLFEGADYSTFLEDYQDRKAILDELKYELADA